MLNHSLFTYAKIVTILCIQTLFANNPLISQKYTADPNAMVWNGRVYVYMSHDDINSDGYDMIDYTLISSDDMVNWTDHGEVFNVKTNTTWANLAYAPTAVPRNGKIYLYFPNGASSIGVAVADRPEGPFRDALGKALITKSMPNCNVEWLFDPGVFLDDDGQAYLYFGGGSSTPGVNLRGIKLNADMISTSGTAVTINSPNSFEAPFVHKYNNKYYFSYSTNPSTGMKIDYQMSDNPLTGYVHKGTALANPTLDGKNINNNSNNHASIVKFNTNWYIFYHDRRLSKQNYFRSASVDLISYNADGTLKPATVTAAGAPQIKNLNPYDTVQAETINLQSGIKTAVCSEGGVMVTSISAGDYIRVKGVDFGAGAASVSVRAASASAGGSIEFRLGSVSGTLVGTCAIPSTGSWTSWKTYECNISNATGLNDLYLVFKGSGEPFRLNWYKFNGQMPVNSHLAEKQSLALKVTHAISTLNVEFTATHNGSTSIKIYNIQGHVVQSTSLQTQSGTIYSHGFDLSGLTHGYYILKVITGHGSESHVFSNYLTR